MDLDEFNPLDLVGPASASDVQAAEEQPYRTEAQRVAAERPRCSFCGEESAHIFEIRADVLLMRGKRICDVCIPEHFTGWTVSPGGWPVRDPLGWHHPPEFDTEPRTHWREIGAALGGQRPSRPVA